jgi:hypothetical protein
MTARPTTGSRKAQRPTAVVVALAFGVALVVVAFGSVVDAHASTRPVIGCHNVVAASLVTGYHVVAPSRDVSAGGCRARGPDYDGSVVGFCVAAETSGAAEDAASAERVFNHYTNEASRAGIDASGQINPGATSGRVFLSPSAYADPITAQSELALPGTPTAGYYQIPESRLPGFGQPGGGLECWVTCPVNITGLKFVPWAL